MTLPDVSAGRDGSRDERSGRERGSARGESRAVRVLEGVGEETAREGGEWGRVRAWFGIEG